jgi:hypothetical protein
MTGVQIIGRQNVLDRYERLGAESWAIYQGKQFIVGGNDSTALDEWLTTFEQTGTTATYYLRTYDYKEVPTSSNGNSDYTACIAFKVVDMYEGNGIAGQNVKLMERIGALEKKLDEQKDQQPEAEGLESVIMGWLEEPEKLAQIAGAVRMIMGKEPIAVEPVKAIGTTQGPPVTPITQDGERLSKLTSALDRLDQADKKLVDHLVKLASLADTDPELFRSIISKLDLL